MEVATIRRRRWSKRTITIFALVSLINAALLVLLWSQLLTPAQGTPQSSMDNSSPLIQKSAPDFTLATLSAHATPPIHLAQLKGKPILLNIWNSACVPCVDEAPLLQKAWYSAHAQGITFVGIDFQDSQADGLGFLQKYGVTYPNVSDASGSIAISYGVTGTPETVLIDHRGIIVQKVVRELDGQTLQNSLRMIAR